MSQSFKFEELDANTRDYLTAVRESQGNGAPGIFAPTTSAMDGCGCVSGVIIVVLTLALTLTNWVDLILKDPTRLAMLQTAGLVLGGWLLVAAMRSSAAKGSKTYAGHWLYVDALHLYEAYREQLTATPIHDVTEASFTHSYNNGSYQNSIVRVALGSGRISVKFKGEDKAEQIVVFLNYLAYARSPEGGDRARLQPVQLGGLARYVAEYDVEPKNHEGTLNLELTQTSINVVPDEPVREGRAAPAVLPYIVLLATGVGIFFLMKEVVNPPLRDDAMFKAITEPPQCTEPVYLRAYLLDDRNTRHRVDVLAKLTQFYDQMVRKVRAGGSDPILSEGMAILLESLDGPDQPTVSLLIEEVGGLPDAQKRTDTFRDQLVGGYTKQGNSVGNYTGLVGALSLHMGSVSPPAGMVFPEARDPIGAQLIDFANKPDDADHAHVEVSYRFDDVGNGLYTLTATIDIRTKLDAPAVVSGYRLKSVGSFTQDQFAAQLAMLRDQLVRGMVGSVIQPAMGGGFVPK